MNKNALVLFMCQDAGIVWRTLIAASYFFRGLCSINGTIGRTPAMDLAVLNG